MQLKLYHVIQENAYYFKGYARLCDLAEVFADYSFSEETREKAAIHKQSLSQGLSAFSVTLRMEPDSEIPSLEEETIFSSKICQIYNGASKIAAICQMDAEELSDFMAMVNLFFVTEEKMRQIVG